MFVGSIQFVNLQRSIKEDKKNALLQPPLLFLLSSSVYLTSPQ
jgi:hypothetical protein